MNELLDFLGKMKQEGTSKEIRAGGAPGEERAETKQRKDREGAEHAAGDF
jgi:hypothetical protein